MNINLKLKLPLINKETNEKKLILVDTQLLLNPLYALEEDIVPSFNTIKEEQLPWLRKILFDNSITVLRLTGTIEKLKALDAVDLFSLRRDFVICMTTNAVAKQLYKDAMSSISRSKTLGDFSVSTATKSDATFINKIIDDSADCMSDMNTLIADIESSTITPRTFSKASKNPSFRGSNRLWWDSELPVDIVDGYASKKYYYNGSGYKAGSFNLDRYSKYRNNNTLDFYRSLKDLAAGEYVSES